MTVFFPTADKVMPDKDVTCDLFRFLQLLCEGHNSGQFANIHHTHFFLKTDVTFDVPAWMKKGLSHMIPVPVVGHILPHLI